MEKTNALEKKLKWSVIIFLIIQPFLDTYYLYTNKFMNVFKFSISTIIRFGIIGFLMIYVLKKRLKEKKYFSVIMILIITLIYSILHHVFTVNFNSVDPNNFNYSFVQDCFYIARLVLPIFMMIIVIDFKFTFKEMLKIIQISSFIIGFIIVFSNLLKIGLCSYNNLVVKDNIIGWFNDAYNTYSYYTLASKGWFNFANQISALIVIFLTFNIYSMFKKTSFFNVTNVTLLTLSALIIGTRVALYGSIGMYFVMIFICLFNALVNKKQIKINVAALSIYIILLMTYAFIYPYSPAKNRQAETNAIVEAEANQSSNETSSELSEDEMENDKIKISELNMQLEIVKNSNDVDSKIDFIRNYYAYYNLDSGFIEDAYSYKKDPDFWLEIMQLPIQNRIDYRYLEQAIIKRVSSINQNKIGSSLFGISYSRVQNIFNIEKDFILQYFTLGIVGLMLFFIIPFILLPLYLAFLMLKKKNINTENILLLLAMFLFVGIGFFSGNLIDALTVTIYIGLILGVMWSLCNEKKTKKLVNLKKITIVALHLGYGGVESSISALANMLSKYFDVEIISTYKLLDKPAFELNSKVKVTYLLESLKPNKEQFKDAVKNKKVFKIFREGFKSLKILFLKKHKLIKVLKKLDTDIVISTRYIHNKWVGKYIDDNTIKIAQEHNHHNNNNKYIKKVLKSLKNIDYFMPVSEELEEFYYKKLKNKKIKIKYIPSALNYFPKETSKLTSKNIVSIGRLSKEKGFTDLIKVYKEIFNKDKSTKLKIIGDGKEKEKIIQLISEENLKNNIEVCGFLNKSEIENIMLKSSLYIMTSFTESFGLVLLEAQSYGLPIIAFDSAQGANQIIENGKNGFLIKNRNIKEMAEKSYKILNDLNLRKELGEYGRKYSEYYKQENILKKWMEFIKEMS